LGFRCAVTFRESSGTGLEIGVDVVVATGDATQPAPSTATGVHGVAAAGGDVMVAPAGGARITRAPNRRGAMA
jgi:hypothetical protein